MRWTFKPEPNPKKIAALAKDLQVEQTIAKILVQRGIETYEQAKDFFRPNLANLHDPFLMKDMSIAVERIEKAIENQENILVYGDYDVDGTTAVALMSTYLREKIDNVGTYVPDRESEGYGISFQGIDFADDNDFSLVIALDCGIRAIDKIEYANKKNINFIICDHHTPGEKLPNAVAILNPKQVDCQYPYKELSGCGVGFKLLQAINQQEGNEVDNIINFLQFVVVSIAADIVPMTGENRILAYHGLEIINDDPSIGLAALKQTSFEKTNINITDVVFGIAPRINAAGRLQHANAAVELLTETSADRASQMAKAINTLNSERKNLDAKITEEALLQIKQEQSQDAFTTVVYDENWHKGVIGIVASRLIETHYRPTIVFSKSGDFLTGSARSVRGYNIYKALEKCDDLIAQWGGHKYAAGLRLKPANYKAFKKKFESVVKNTIKPELRLPEVPVDSEIFLSEISLKFYRIIQQMAPFGPRNMQPVFAASGLRDNGTGRRVGKDESHLKLSIIDGSNPKTYNGIAFGLGDKYPLIKKSFKTIFTIDENHWNGNTSIQLKIKDIKPDL